MEKKLVGRKLLRVLLFCFISISVFGHTENALRNDLPLLLSGFDELNHRPSFDMSGFDLSINSRQRLLSNQTSFYTPSLLFKQGNGLAPEVIAQDCISSQTFFPDSSFVPIIKTNEIIISTGTSRNWSDVNTWVGGRVPGAGDDVVIAAGTTVIIDDTASVCNSITINGTLNIIGAFTLQVNGNWTNNGTFTGTNGIVEFTGSTEAIISGTAITVFKEFKINKGSSRNDLLAISGPVTITRGGKLTLINGLLKINAGGSLTSNQNSRMDIPLSGGIQVDGGLFATGDFPVINHGLFQVSSGTATLGQETGNNLQTETGGVFQMDGGTLNVTGRLVNTAGTATITGGTINISTIGHASSTVASFDMGNAADLDIQGGFIRFNRPNASATNRTDVNIIGGGSKTITGGTFQMGTESTPSGSTFVVNSEIPLHNLTLYNPNSKVSLKNDLTVNNQLSLNGRLTLNDKNLIIGATAPAINGNLGAGAGMVVATIGEIRKLFSSAGSYVFPVGTVSGTAEYSPVKLTFTDGTFNENAYAALKVFNEKHPQNDNADYLKRYWTINTSTIIHPVFDVTASYVPEDVIGSETSLNFGSYDGTKWLKNGSINRTANSISVTGVNDLSHGFSSIASIAIDPPTATISGTTTICAGNSAPLTVTLTGTQPWSITYTDGTTSVTEANIGTNSYVINVSPATTRPYTLTAVSDMNFTGSITVPGSATVTVNPLPTVDTQPTSPATVCGGIGTVTFTVAATLPGLGYRWQVNTGSTWNNVFNNVVYSNVTTSTLTITNPPIGMNGYKYRCNITGGCIPPALTTDGLATLSVAAIPTITTAASGTNVCFSSGSQTTPLTYSATIGTPTTYSISWNAIPANSFAAVTDVALPLTPINITVPAGTSAGTYTGTITVKNAAGCTSSGTNLTVTVDPLPVISVQPTSPAAICGATGTATLTVGATGTNLSYRWWVNTGSGWSTVSNGGVYSNVTTTTLTVINPPIGMNGYKYRCVVTASCLAVVSSDGLATLSVGTVPTITTGASATGVCYSASSQTTPLTYSATTGTPTTYSISWNGVPANSFAAVTDAALPSSPINITIPAGTAEGSYTGTITVKNASGCSSTGTTFTVTVDPLPDISVQPTSSADVCGATGTATFTVGATGTNLSYRWWVNTGSGWSTVSNGGVYSNVTTTTLTIINPPIGMNGYKYRCNVTASCLAVVSSDGLATLSVGTVPTITTGASATGVCYSASSQTTPLTYSTTTGTPTTYSISWNGVPANSFAAVTDAALPSSPINITVPAGTAEGTYSGTITVKNASGCSSTGTNFTVTVDPLPVISVQPTSPAAICGATGTVTFTVGATGTNLSYRWWVNTGSGWSTVSNGGAYSNVTTTTLTVINPPIGMNGYKYRCVVTASCSAVVSSDGLATLSVDAFPAITTGASATGVCFSAGSQTTPLTYSTTTGTPTTYSISWNALPANSFEAVTDASLPSSPINITVPAGTAAGTYTGTITVKTASGCVSTGTNFTVTVNDLPAISVQPTSPETVCGGTGTATFTVVATGTGLSYRWQADSGSGWLNVSNGGVYSNVTGTTLTITNSTIGMNGYKYRCVVSGTCTPAVNSDGLATLSVDALPKIVGEPTTPLGVCDGTGTATFIVTATGTGLTYQWQEYISSWNNVSDVGVYSGVTSPSLVITNATSGMNGYRYRCVVSGTCTPIVYSDGLATLSVNDLPAITLQPNTPAAICAGAGTATVTIAATGTNLSYRWWVNTGSGWSTVSNGAVYSNVTTIAITITNPPVGFNSYKYRCVVSGICTPSAISDPVTITVNPIPTVTSPGNQIYCEGIATSAIALTGTPLLPLPGVKFDISGGLAIGLADASGVTAIPAFTPITGNATITITPKANNCTGTTVTFNVTVRPTPTTTISGGTTVCRGTSAPIITFSNPQSLAILVTYKINTGSNSTIAISPGLSATINAPTNTAGTFNYNLVSVQYQSVNNCPTNITGITTVNVLATPTATISGIATVCQGGAQPAVIFNNPQVLPVTVTYDINGTIQPTIDIPASNTATVSAVTTNPGIFNYNLVSVVYQGGIACSSSISGSATITVNPAPTATIGGGVSVCQNSSPSPNITITNPQANPITVAYTINNGASVNQNVPASTTFSLPVNTSIAGSFTYKLVSVQYQNAPNCPNPIDVSSTVVVLATPTASISGAATVCKDATQPALTFTNPQALPVTVTYNINGSNQSTINIPASTFASLSAPTNTSGTFNYNLVSVVYQGSTTCSNTISGSAAITVRPAPTATIGGGASVCQFSSPSPNITITNPQAIPITVAYTINNGASVNQNVAANTSFSIPVNSSTSGTYTYKLVSVQYQNVPSCPNPINVSATVIVLTKPTATISGTTTVCRDVSQPTVTFTNPQALPITVTYDINGSNQTTIDIPASTFSSLLAPTNVSGTFNYNLISVVYQGGAACINNTTGSYATILVQPKPTVTSPGNRIYCAGISTTAIPLVGSPTGVVFDITGGAAIGLANQPGVTSIPSFIPIAGTATVLLTPRANSCSGAQVSFTISVTSPPTMTCPGNLSLCYSPSSFALPAATPAGGTYSGTGVTGSTFYPATAGIGTHLITYSYTDAASTCQNSCTFSITLKPIPVILNQTTTICNGGTFVVSPQNGVPAGTIVPAGITYSWLAPTLSPANSATGSSAQSNQSSISQTLTLTNANTAATVTYNVTPTANGCPGTPFTVVVTVNPNPIALNATFHQQYINDPAYDILNICDGESVYNVADNDLEVFYWNGSSWVYPAPNVFNSYTWGWQYSLGTPDGPWVDAVGVVTVNYEYKMPPPPSLYSPIGEYYFRFFITNANGCTSYTDKLHLSISSDYLTVAGDQATVLCSATPAAIPLTGSSISGTGGPSARWSITSLDPTNAGVNGSLSSTAYRTDPYNVNYTPPPNYVGIVTLTLTSTDPPDVCLPSMDTKTIIVAPVASTFAGNPQSVCTWGTVQLEGILQGSATGATWSVSPAGSGTFSDPNSLTSTFIPSITSGTVALTLTPNNTPGACVKSSSVDITVNPAPQASGVTICEGGTGSLTSSTSCPGGGSTTLPTRFPGIGENVNIGNPDWSNPTRIRIDDNSYSTVTLGRGINSDYLRATNFGFSVPPAATITGIQVTIGKGADNSRIRDNIISLVKNGTIAGSNLASTGTDWPDGYENPISHGGTTELWGETWTPAQLNAANFGVVLSARNTSGNYGNRIAYVDYIRITVTYTLSAEIKWYASTGGSPIGTGSPFNPVAVTGSGLPNTNTPGTYSFYAECTSYTGCRTTANFVINPKPTVTKPANIAASACTFANQAALNAAFATWIAGFTVTGGASPVGSFQGGTPTAPVLCTGGTINAIFNYTDLCENGSVSASFAITTPTALSINNPGNVTRSACEFANQAAVNTAFATWVAGFSATGGCNPQVSFSGGTPIAPALCGGSVTATYNVTDLCNSGSVTATYTITGTSSVTITKPLDVSKSSCEFASQAAVDAAFATWLTGFSFTGGCSGSGSYGTPTAPSWCNGGISEVTLSYSDVCRTVSASATFTITKPADLVVSKPNQANRNSSEFANQAAVNAAFAAWLTGFSASGGCSPSGSYGTPVAPDLCAGGTVTVTYSVTDACQSGSSSETFTLNGPVALVVNKPTIFVHAACEYATQADLNSVFANWLLGFSTTGGTNPQGSFAVPPVAPVLCAGGTVTVTYNVTDVCAAGSSTSETFTINKPAALVINKPFDFVATACNYATQTALNTAFTNWLTGFSVTGGCSVLGSFAGVTPTAPDICDGGTVTVTYNVTDLCESASPSATFTVPAVADLDISYPNDITQNSCQTQAAIDAAFATWVGSFGYSGGCNVTATNLSGYTAPLACGGSVEIAYSASDNCGQAENISRTFTVTDTPDLVVSGPGDVVEDACQPQADIETAYNTWKAGFAFLGGCSATDNIASIPVLPVDANCKGTILSFRYTVTDNCGQTDYRDATFTVGIPPVLTISCPVSADQEVPVNTGNTYKHSKFIANWDASASDNCGTLTLTAQLSGITTTGPHTTLDNVVFNNGTTTVTWTATDECGQTASCTFDVVVNGTADLSIAKTGPATATVGTQFEYTIVVTNNGPVTAPAVIVNDAVPFGFLNPEFSTDNGTTWDPWTGSATWPGSLDKDATATILLRGTPDCTAIATPLSNFATVDMDPNTANNTSATVITTVTDVTPPTFDMKGPFEFCVSNIISAIYDGQPEPDADIIPLGWIPGDLRRPDWYIVTSGSTELDITNLDDNCCKDPNDLNISWVINFTGGVHSAISGSKQPSQYDDPAVPGAPNPIKLWGATDYSVIQHTITYTVTDCNSPANKKEQTQTITINPRPNITKVP